MSDFVIENGILMEYTGPGGDVVVPEGVTAIGGSAFTEARFLEDDYRPVTSVILPEGVREIGRNAFNYCQELKKVVLPQSLEKIGSFAFCDCPELTELVIPDSVTEIGDRGFAGCKKLNVSLPPNLKTIEEAAFRGCALKQIIIPAGVTKVGKDAFKNCTGIQSAGPVGSKYDYQFPWTEEIPDNAFSGLKKLKIAVLPATVKKVGGNAFNGCKVLIDLTMPKAAKVHKTAFKGCEKLVDIKDTAENAPAVAGNPDFLITNGRLSKYRGVNPEVIIPEGVTVIGRKAFWAESITSVTIPTTVTSIEQEGFGNCVHLEKVTILGKIERVGAMAFGWMRNEKIEHDLYTAIPIKIFAKCDFGGQDNAVQYFCEHIAELDGSSEVYQDNLQFMGKHLKQATQFNKTPYTKFLAENEAFCHALLESGAIPAKDVDGIMEELAEYPQIVAALLEYKNRILSNPRVKKAMEKAEERAMEKAFSTEMSVADWRKVFKFSYEDGEAVIKETRSGEPEILVPTKIGSKAVKAVDAGAFRFAGGQKSPKTITISGGIREIRTRAFLVVSDCEVFLPSSVTSLPSGCFTAVRNLTLHIPGSVTEIADDLVWDSPDNAVKAICAPVGSAAEIFAKAHRIPFIAE